MSFQAVHYVLEYSDVEESGARLVLLCLAAHTNPDGTGAWPSIRKLAAEARMSERNVRYCLRKLEDHGAIVRNGVSPYGTNIYDVVLREPGTDEGGQPIAGEQDLPGGNGLPGGRQDVAGEGGQLIASNQSYNQSNESFMYEEGPPSAPDLPQVLRELDRIADAKAAKRPRGDAVLKVMRDFPEKDHVQAAKDLHFWMLHGNGRRKAVKSVVQTYRTFVARAQERKGPSESARDIAMRMVAEDFERKRQYHQRRTA